MNLSEMLLEYAIESGAIKQPQLMSDDELLMYSMECAEREIDSGFALVDTLETMAEDQPEEVTEESLESYQRQVGLVLRASGMKIPASVVVPSFESAEKSGDAKKSLKDKAKSVVEAIIKWIKDRLKWLGELWQKAKAAMTGRKKKADAAAQKAKDDAKTAKDEGVDEVVTPEAATTEEKDAQSEHKDEGKKRGNFTKVVPAAGLPSWLLTGEKLSLEKVRSLVKGTLIATPGIMERFTKAVVSDLAFDAEGMPDFAAIVERSVKAFKAAYPLHPTTARWRASVGELEQAIQILKDGIAEAVTAIDTLDKGRVKAEQELDQLKNIQGQLKSKREALQKDINAAQQAARAAIEAQALMQKLIDIFGKALAHAAGSQANAA